MSGVSSHMLFPQAGNKEEPHVPTGCFLRMGELEAEYRSRLLSVLSTSALYKKSHGIRTKRN